MQAEYAADNSISVNLKPLETLFEQQGLFAVLEDRKLVTPIEGVWNAAIQHNGGLSLPGGSQRSQELKDKTYDLRDGVKRADL